MAAQTLTAKQKKAAVSGSIYKKKVTMKSVLYGPYSYTWKKLNPERETEVHKELSRTFETLNMKRPSKEKPDGKDKKKTLSGCKTKFTEEQKQLRCQLTIGLSGTTRALERNELRLILVNLSCSSQLHKHLIQLTAVRDCPAVAVHNLTQTLGPLLTVNSVIAIGFKKLKSESCTKFDSLIENLKTFARPIYVPWLKKTTSSTSTKQKTTPIGNQVDSREHGLLQNQNDAEKTEGAPLKNAKQIYKAKPDEYYNRFYIYKKSKTSFGDSFISLGNSGSYVNKNKEQNRSRRKPYPPEADTSEPSFKTHGIMGAEQPASDECSNTKSKRKDYQTTIVGSLQSNPNKIKKKKTKLR